MRQIALWLCAVLASLTLAMSGTGAMAELPPRPDGPVLDAAGIIPDGDEAALDAKLRAYNKDTGRAIIVATVRSLNDQPVEDYAQQLAEKWDIGGAESEQGVLFLVAPTERKIRIHTARGVQERLPDVLAGRIIRDAVTPLFKARNMGGGINAGVDAIIAQLNRDPADAKAVAEAAAAAAKQRRGGSEDASIGAVIFWIVLILFLIMLFGRGRRRHGLRRHSDAGIVMWEAGNLAANIAANIAINAALGGRGGDSGGFGGFGGFGGGGGGFDGGGASGDW